MNLKIQSKLLKIKKFQPKKQRKRDHTQKQKKKEKRENERYHMTITLSRCKYVSHFYIINF